MTRCAPRFIVALALALVGVPDDAGAQAVGAERHPWAFTTRVLMTGSSDESEPPGYHIYSAVTLEAALRRSITRLLGAELTVRTESREVDSLVPTGEDRRLGSLELLPLSLLLHFAVPTRGKVHPYAGAGLNLTVAWEKSGTLDSTDMAGSVGPALQVGVDFDLAPSALLNVDLRWNHFTADLKNADTPLAELKVDPLALGIGVGFRF